MEILSKISENTLVFTDIHYIYKLISDLNLESPKMYVKLMIDWMSHMKDRES